MGPVTLDAVDTDSNAGERYVVQVDAWADLTRGGGQEVNEMLSRVTVELAGSQPALDGFTTLYLGIETGAVVDEYDQQLARQIAHGFVRYIYTIYNE
jgi:hypothetical protein